MKSYVSALGMATAAFAVATSAGAADLPSRKAAPVEYVRVCSAYGAGFFYIPGTDTCLRVGGRVRAEYAVGDRFGNGQDAYGTRARGRLNVDARTATAYGTLRAFFRYELTNNSGMYNAGTTGFFNTGSGVPGATGAATESARTNASTGSSPNLDLAFIQFGPITAGRAQSFFDFFASDNNFASFRTSDSRLNLLAYTATFGSGFSATISLEDRVSGTQNRENTAFFRNSFNPTAVALGGQDFPDVVASLRVDQGWGSAQLSGALTNRRTVSTAGSAAPFVLNATTGQVVQADFGSPAYNGNDEYGWAIQGGVKLNLPMLAAGDVLWLQAAYADGALGYLGWSRDTFGMGRLGKLALGDVGVDTGTGRIKNSTGFSLVASLRHFWTPTLRSEITASYSELKLAHVNPSTMSSAGVGSSTYFLGAGQNAGTPGRRSLDPKELLVGANLIWSPVSGLDIGVEMLYSHLEVRDPVRAVQNNGTRNALIGVKSEDSLSGRFRIQRDF